jgi:hypothetical protein
VLYGAKLAHQQKKTVQSQLTLQDFGDWVQIQTDANHQYFYANDAKMYKICPN